MVEKQYSRIRKKYKQKTIRERIEALFKDNVGKIVTREQIIQVATDPNTGNEPENWHQRLSELRTDEGYTILSHRDRKYLKICEYLMPSPEHRPIAKKRVNIDPETWKIVLERANHRCEWKDRESVCGLKEGEIDSVGGGTVELTPDHKTPHSTGVSIDPKDPNQWQALCGRHQVIKKNYWDDRSGRLNVYAIIQSASVKEKKAVYNFLKDYFGD